MYAKNIKPSAKREIQTERSAKRNDRIVRPRRVQTFVKVTYTLRNTNFSI